MLLVIPRLEKKYFLYGSWKNPCRSSLKGARNKYNAVGVFLLLLSMISLEVTAASPTVSERTESRIEFNIPQQVMDAALIEFSEQADLTLVFPGNLVRDRYSNILIGSYTLQEGIDVLLLGTGLNAFFRSKIMLTIEVEKPRLAVKENTIKIKNKTWVSKLGSILSVLFVASPLSAQEGQEPEALRIIEEVMVTATRRETSAQDTPISISVFSDDSLAKQGVESFEGISRQTPGVILTGSNSFSRFVVRGIQTSSTSSSNGEQRQVAVYYDDVPVTSFSVVTPNLRLFDIERVEVLRGPQGTSFGSGSLSGAVRVVTQKANTDGFDSALRVDIGDIDEGGIRQRYSGMVNVPLSDSFAIRLVGYGRDEDGFIDNIGSFGRAPVEDENSSDEKGYRASAVWQAAEGLKLTFSHSNDEQELLSLAGTQQTGLGKYKRSTYFSEPLSVDMSISTLTVDYDLSWAAATLSTSRAAQDTSWDLDLDALFGPVLPFGYGESVSSDTKIHELRLVSEDSDVLSWLAGFYWFDLESKARGAQFADAGVLSQLGVNTSGIPSARSPGATISTVNRDVETYERALYGEVDWHLSDTLSLVLGARYTRYQYDNYDRGNFATDTLGLAFTGGGVPSIIPLPDILSTTKEQNETTVKASLMWTISESQSMYFSAGEGFRRPHPNTIRSNVVDSSDPGFIPAIADADSLWNYEVGYKGVHMDGALGINAALYFIKWDDAQLSASRQSDAAPYVTNGGDIESYGLEVDIRYFASNSLEFGGSLSLSESEVKSIDQLAALTSGLEDGANLVSPTTQISAYLEYRMWERGDTSINLRTDIQYSSAYFNGPPNIPGVGVANPRFAKTDDITNVTAQIGYETLSWGVYLYGENLSSEDGRTWQNPDPFSNNNVVTLNPRTIGLRFDYRY